MNTKIRLAPKKIWPFKEIIDKLDGLYQKLDEKENLIAELDKRLDEAYVKNEELHDNINSLSEENQRLVT